MNVHVPGTAFSPTNIPLPSGHIWTQADDRGISECTKGCGVYRLFAGRITHRVLYSRSDDSKNATWREQAPPCRRVA